MPLNRWVLFRAPQPTCPTWINMTPLGVPRRGAGSGGDSCRRQGQAAGGLGRRQGERLLLLVTTGSAAYNKTGSGRSSRQVGYPVAVPQRPRLAAAGSEAGSVTTGSAVPYPTDGRSSRKVG